MIIGETRECNELKVDVDINADLRQFGEWIQIDKQQAAQLVEVLQRWLADEEVE